MFSRGRRLGLDIGTVRIGVAMSDPDAILATPVETIAADSDDLFIDWDITQDLSDLILEDFGNDFHRILEIIEEYSIKEIILGLPITLAGKETESTRRARFYAHSLEYLLHQQGIKDIPVHLVDERLSTMAATQNLRASGRSSKKGRSVIDQAAAVHFLQGWLDRHAGKDSHLI